MIIAEALREQVAYGLSAAMFQVDGSFQVGKMDARLSELTPEENASTVPRTFCPKLPEYSVVQVIDAAP